MFGLRKVSPTKLATARKERPRSQIVKNADEKITEQDLYNWEKGLNAPRIDKIPYLLKGLGVSFEEISDEVSLEIAV